MRAIRNISDVEVVLRDVFDKLDNLKTKPLSLNLNQVKQIGDAIDPQDAVTLKQLQAALPNGFNGSFFYVKSINFTNSTYVTGTIIVTNGVITGVL